MALPLPLPRPLLPLPPFPLLPLPLLLLIPLLPLPNELILCECYVKAMKIALRLHLSLPPLPRPLLPLPFFLPPLHLFALPPLIQNTKRKAQKTRRCSISEPLADVDLLLQVPFLLRDTRTRAQVFSISRLRQKQYK